MVDRNNADELAILASNDIENLSVGGFRFGEARTTVLRALVAAQQTARNLPADECAQAEYLRQARIYYDTYIKA